jgi:hypothetical protein
MKGKHVKRGEFIAFFLFIIVLATNASALNVGYYDMCDGQGDPNQVNSITIAGHTPVNLTDLSSTDLAGVDVIYVQNCSNNMYGAEYLNRLADIEAAVASGKRLIIHDRFVTDAETILPGGGSFNIVRDFLDSRDINIRDNTTLVTNGPGGTLDDTSLDGGDHSSHGYADANSLPLNARLILTRGNPDEIVTFSYPYGAGCVVYSTIPLDFYLAGSGPNPPRDNFALIYAPNVVAYAAEECQGGSIIDIKANGSDGPVTLQHGDPLSVTIALTPGDMAGQNADWWVIARDPSYRYYFYNPNTDAWVPKCLSCVPLASYQGGLVNMGPYEVLNTTAGPQMSLAPGLPVGTYTFYFGVDLNMDGKLDMDQMYYDSVVVNISGP